MRRHINAIASSSDAGRTSSQSAISTDVDSGLEVVAFRLVLAAERHRG
jgi:hypothetical protein